MNPDSSSPAAAHQFTCVALQGRAVLIDGASGAGKTSLALALIDRGATLVGDDSLLLENSGGQLIARPHPRTAGKIEVRNLGIIEAPVLEQAHVALWLTLDPEAPRFIDCTAERELAGATVPYLKIWPGEASLMAIKVEIALTNYGLYRMD